MSEYLFAHFASCGSDVVCHREGAKGSPDLHPFREDLAQSLNRLNELLIGEVRRGAKTKHIATRIGHHASGVQLSAQAARVRGSECEESSDLSQRRLSVAGNHLGIGPKGIELPRQD